MNYYYQRFLLVLGTFGVAGVLFISFFAKLARETADVETLPLGLTLVERDHQLVVERAMPAARNYGIRRGDVIQFVEEHAVSTEQRFREILAEKQPGDRISIGVLRDGQTVAINQRFHGPIEAVADQVNLAKSKPPADKTPLQEAVVQSVLATPEQDTLGHKTFGLQLRVDKDRLIVTRVAPDSAGAAFGIEVGDVLFQVDQIAIDSVQDFHRVAAGKSAGDTANIMLIRGDSIVLLPSIVLGGSGKRVVAPEDYEPVVMAFSSLTEEALAELLEDPFRQFSMPISNALDQYSNHSVPPAPKLDESARQSLDRESHGDVFVPIPLGAALAEVPRQDTASTLATPVAQELSLKQTSNIAESRVTRFSDVEVDSATSIPSAKVIWGPPPESTLDSKAVPRFHKYSMIRLPDPPPAAVPDTINRATVETSLTGTTEVRSRYDRDSFGGQATTSPTPRSDPPQNKPLRDDGSADVDGWGDKKTPQPAPARAKPLVSPQIQSTDLVQSRPYPTEKSPGDYRGSWDLPRAKDAAFTLPKGEDQINPRRPLTAAKTKPVTSYLSEDHPLARSLPSNDTMCTDCGEYDCMDCDSPGGSGLGRIFHDTADSSLRIGGWLSAGYHSESNGLFNDRPDEFALHQGWLYVEREATSQRPFGF